jgi:glycosyltransferase involved in cell wall biosynthesis
MDARPTLPTPTVSVIVPTRNSAQLTGQLLPSLAEQKNAPAYELIVVDNGSTDDTAAVIRKASERWPHVSLVSEARPGCGRARHAGALISKAPLLMFVDGDMEACPDLIAQHVQAHESTPNTCVLGNILSAPRKHPFERMLAYIYDGPRQTLAGREVTYEDCWPGNMSLSREIYFGVGGFDDRYADLGGEEWDFAQRLAAARVPLQFVPKALTRHHFSSHFGPRLRRAYINGVVYGYFIERYPHVNLGGFARPKSHNRLRSRLLETACRAAATVFEPFDRGEGVPMKPLAFLYDLGLRTATERGIYDYFSGGSPIKERLCAPASAGRDRR